jgi:DNA-binding beta-propeller fold protein YncE
VVGLALVATPASAITTHPFLRAMDGSGMPDGGFTAAARVAVDQESGEVYVVNLTNLPAGTGAVEVFDSSGTFQREIKGEGTPAGSFAFSRTGTSGVAVDASGGPLDGDVYVADTRNNVVDVLNSDGYERQLAGLIAPTGVVVDQNGHVWVAESGDGEDANGMVHEFDEAGNLLQSWPTGYFSIADIAVDSTSRVYLVNGRHGGLPLDRRRGRRDVHHRRCHGHRHRLGR